MLSVGLMVGRIGGVCYGFRDDKTIVVCLEVKRGEERRMKQSQNS